FNWRVIEDRRFEDPLTRRLYSRASKREMAADGCSLHNKPYFLDGNFHLDCPCGVQFPDVRRLDWVDSVHLAALKQACGNLFHLLRQGRGGRRRRRFYLVLDARNV